MDAAKGHPRVRVLHIDDEEEQLMFAKLFLEEADKDLEVVGVKSFSELLEHLDDSVDCVISDYVMPGADGMELCRAVKRRHPVPFILYTGRGSEVVAEAAFKSGVDDYVRKESDPSHYQLLARRIRSHAENYWNIREQTRYQHRLEDLRSNLHLLTEASTMLNVGETTFDVLSRIFGCDEGWFSVVEDGRTTTVLERGLHPPSLNASDLAEMTEVDGAYMFPLRIDETIGVIGVKNGKGFSSQDMRLMDTLWLMVAQSIHRINQMETIRASEEQFRSIVENVQDIVMLTDSTGAITYISPSVNDIFGYPPGPLKASMWGDMVHCDDLGKLEEFYSRSLKGEKGSIKEYRVLTSGGETRWVSHSWTPILKDGEVRVVVNAINDITWRKSTEEALQVSLDELEQTNRDLNDFTHVVSHDLKSPLMTIESFTSFLLEDYGEALDDVGRDYLGRVMEASGRMTGLIDDLLTLSRVGRKFTEYTSVDMNRVVQEALDDLEAQVKKSGAVVKVHPMPEIVAQEVWVKQLFVNLIGNGIKFNESKPPRVEVTHRDMGDSHYFEVKDNGIGIPEDQRGLLFKVFQRLHTEKEYPGTGAGLSICKKIVESMGGSIGVESQEGFGSVFYFTIPRNLPIRAADAQVSREVPASNLGKYL